MVRPENIHISNTVQTQQVIPGNMYADTNTNMPTITIDEEKGYGWSREECMGGF